MNEIERAIAYWEEFEREIDEMPHSDILEAQREPVKTALAILRAELSRQENAPLTCDGCKHEGKYVQDILCGIRCPCNECSRVTIDRYEPKGEQSCTQD